MAHEDYWWNQPEKHEGVFRAVTDLRQQQAMRKVENLRFARLYGNTDVVGLTPKTHGQTEKPLSPDRLTFNIVQSVIDTVSAKIAKNRPKPMYLTSGGNYSQREEAKKLTKFTEGLFYEAKAREHTLAAFKFAGVFGTGPVKVFEEGGRVACEAVLPEELTVDEADGMYGCPRQLFQHKFVSRDVLAEQYPEEKLRILDAKPSERLEEGVSASYARSSAHLLEVVEGWHLPSGEGAKDGRHVIAIDGLTLIDEPWTETRFPFAFFRWNRRLVGFWGQGIAEQLLGIQVDINRTLQKIQKILHLCSTPRIVKRKSAKIPDAWIRNNIGDILEVDDPSDVQIQAFNSVPPELWQHLRDQIARGYEVAGVSQLSAGARKPSGLDAAVALREYNDIESERFVLVGQAWEEFHLDLADLMLRCAKKIADRFGEEGEKKQGYRVRVPDKRELEFIDLADINLDDDKYVMQAYPVSRLPSTPAGRQQAVMEWMQAGWVTPEEGRRLLDFPDLENSSNLAVAAQDAVHAILDRILETGEYIPPEPFHDLALGVKWAQAKYLRAQLDGYPEERLSLLRDWATQAAEMIPPPPAPPAPAAPQLPAEQPPLIQ